MTFTWLLIDFLILAIPIFTFWLIAMEIRRRKTKNNNYKAASNLIQSRIRQLESGPAVCKQERIIILEKLLAEINKESAHTF